MRLVRARTILAGCAAHGERIHQCQRSSEHGCQYAGRQVCRFVALARAVGGARDEDGQNSNVSSGGIDFVSSRGGTKKARSRGPQNEGWTHVVPARTSSNVRILISASRTKRKTALDSTTMPSRGKAETTELHNTTGTRRRSMATMSSTTLVSRLINLPE